MNTKSTELDFTEKDHPEFTRYFWKNLLYAIGVAVFCGTGIVFTLINKQFIDDIKPQVQIVIWALALGTYGIVRLVIWFRQKF